MHPRTSELLDHLDRHHQGLREATDSVPLPLRSQRPAPEQWSVAEVLEHLGIAEGRITQLFSTSLAEARATGLGAEVADTPVLPTVNFDGMTDRGQRLRAPDPTLPTGTIDAEHAWNTLEETHSRLDEAILSSDGLALSEITRPHKYFGPLNLYQWAAFAGAHRARHAAQIREIGERLTAAR